MSMMVIADDEPGILGLLSRLFINFGHTVYTAVNGLEAWQLIQQHQPQLVISDVTMPVMTGTELLTQIKSSPELTLKNTKVILMSGMPIEDAEHRADAYVVKPFVLHQIQAVVEQLIGDESVAS